MTLVLLSAALIASIVLTGGVYPAQWNWCLVLIGIAAITNRVKNPTVDRISTALLGVIAACAVLQIVPLPAAVVGVLSPARFELSPERSFMTLSAAPYETAQQILTLAAYYLIFVLIRSEVSARKSPWIVIWPLLLIAPIESVIGIFQMPIAHGTYVSRNHLAGLLEMILPFAVMYPIAILRQGSTSRALARRAALKAWPLLVTAVLIIVAILHSYSRMGFLSSLVALAICAAMSISPRWRIPAIGIMIVVAMIYVPDEPFIARFSNLWGDARFQIWPGALDVVKSFPVFGCGLGAFESCYARFQTVLPMYRVDYAHNDYIQIMAELGPIAWLAGLLFAARLLVHAIRRSRTAPSADQRLLSIACTAAISALLLHSFFDFNLYIPANGAVFAWICGIASNGLDSPTVVDSPALAKSRKLRLPLRGSRVLWRP